MSLPGVRTILKDRFYSLSRTDAPEGTRIAVLARRNNTAFEGESVTNFESLPATGTEQVLVRSDGRRYTYDEIDGWTSTDDQGAYSVEPDFTHYTPRSERDVIAAFGEFSDAHLAYVETTAGGAGRVILVPLPDVADGAIAGELEAAFEEAEVARADIIVPWGNSDGGFDAKVHGAEVIRMCKLITDRSNPVFAVMGVSGDASNVGAFLDGLDLERVTDGQYLVTVVTQVRPTAYTVAEQRYANDPDNTEPLDLGWGNGAPQVAGLLSTLPSETAATGKRLRGVEEMRFEPNRAQQRRIIDMGGVPVTRNYSRQTVVVDGQTSAPRNSDYVRLSTLRIVFDAIQLVRRATEPFIGEAATLDHKNAMETAVTSALRDMKLAGALLDADSVVTYAPRENKAYIDLVLTPAFEIRNIEVAISVQL